MMGPALAASLPWLGGSLVIVIALALLKRPLSAFCRLVGRTGVGLAFLAVFSPVGQALGAGLGINLFNAVILGALGAPGFGLLLLLRWALH